MHRKCGIAAKGDVGGCWFLLGRCDTDKLNSAQVIHGPQKLKCSLPAPLEKDLGLHWLFSSEGGLLWAQADASQAWETPQFVFT